MYIQNQKFADQETLLEQLFDFGLGEPSAQVKALMNAIDVAVSNDADFQAYKATLTDEEEIMELDDDERRIALGEQLMALYESFVVEKNQLFGSKDNILTLLYSIDF